LKRPSALFPAIFAGLAATLLVAMGECSRDDGAPRTRVIPRWPVPTPSSTGVPACVDEVPWFPFTFPVESEEGRVTGATTELVREVFRRRGLVLSIEPLPWKRCMLALQQGHFAITYDAIIGDERRDRFVFSEPFYAMPQIFYYLGARYPQAPSDFSRLRICGVLGYSYPGLPFDATRIDADARSPTVMINKLRAGRCDLAIGYQRPFTESAQRGELDLDGLRHTPIPGAAVLSLGMMTARGNARGAEILTLVDQVMGELREDGTYVSIMKQFGVEHYAVGIGAGGLAPE
jgi:ABC-type amino acid transport substrate-binding protein